MIAKRIKSIICLLLVFSFLLKPSITLAAIEAYMLPGENNQHYEYNFAELLSSYNKKGLLWNNFYSRMMKHGVKAVYDNVSKLYIDFNALLQAYNKGTPVLAYTENSSATSIDPPPFLQVVSVENNKLIFTKKYLDPELHAFDDVNSAATTGEMITALEKHALTLELDLTDYHKLSPHCKNSVADHVIGQKPAEGYEAKEAIKAVFDTGVAAATAVLEEAVTAINNAASKDEMKTALCGKAQILGLSLTQYDSLSEENKNLVAEILLAAKPYGSFIAIRTAFNEAVNQALGKSINISYTDYNYTLQDMVAIQMSRSPQTDLYGGGWKDAKEEDVAYFVNPLNFYDPNYDGTSKDAIVINTDALRLRERPSTASATLANVYQNELYVIL
ncbi:MAG TPA: hypothetical protein GX697_06230, partial [Firmicutes bacterium]|nr:hypothetical protein [Bacillota bacterium]